MSLTNSEMQSILDFCVREHTEDNEAKIFRTEQKDSYYIDSREAKKYDDRIMEYGFSNPMQLEKLLKETWTEGDSKRELIPTVKVATFKMRDKYDSKYKDLSLYNYTL